MPAPAALVTGIGMVTAVGLTAAETAASVRSGIMRFEESSVLDRRHRPITLAEAPEDGLPGLADALAGAGLTGRERRMVRLASLALAECLTALPAGHAPPPAFVSLPEMETSRPLDDARFLEALAVQLPGAFDAGRSSAAFRGRAGGLQAIDAATALVAGGAPFAVCGGVDTFLDLFVLEKLDVARRVRSAVNLDGFIPGEGAAFLLVSRPEDAARVGVAPLAALSRAAFGFEEGHLLSEQPYRGDGLAGVVAQLLDATGSDAPVRRVYSSMNGESHWAKEWGVALLRNRKGFVEDVEVVHPADCFGDAGAASGPILAGLAALDLRDGSTPGPCLVYASSDAGPRAALRLARV